MCSFNSSRRISRLRSFCILCAINVIFLTALYSGYCAYRSLKLYNHIKKPVRGLSGRVYRADPMLGFAPVPGSRGAHLLPPKPDIPIQYDNDGFRVPQGSPTPEGRTRLRPLVLALGCSYTYGDACNAEDTFVWRVGRLVHGSSINAGGCGYALTHMLLLARTLIPRYKPDYVLIQYSPWLVPRGQSYFAPSYYGKVTNPFFAETPTGIGVHRPVFMPIVFDLPFDRYKKSPETFSDFASFLVRVGLPLHAYEDFNMLVFFVKRRAGHIPLPARDSSAIMKAAYNELVNIARDAGARPFIIALSDGIKPLTIPEEIHTLGIPVVNAYAELMGRLPEPTTEYYARAYVHWNDSNPPEVIDAHPNPLAHEIIAEAIIAAMQDQAGKRRIQPGPPPLSRNENGYGHSEYLDTSSPPPAVIPAPLPIVTGGLCFSNRPDNSSLIAQKAAPPASYPYDINFQRGSDE